mmetsp:Transcript_65175/g.190676  ORF Transcript_65175/g.190676 Transcript_65175/m.190676 type:complete len:202 (-) Transcript_65175:4241-4846(-)
MSSMSPPAASAPLAPALGRLAAAPLRLALRGDVLITTTASRALAAPAALAPSLLATAVGAEARAASSPQQRRVQRHEALERPQQPRLVAGRPRELLQLPLRAQRRPPPEAWGELLVLRTLAIFMLEPGGDQPLHFARPGSKMCAEGVEHGCHRTSAKQTGTPGSGPALTAFSQQWEDSQRQEAGGLEHDVGDFKRTVVWQE